MTSIQALEKAAALGPYFVWEPWTADAGWRPWTELADAEVAAEQVEAARATLIHRFGLPEEDVPARVVASVTLLGWAARVMSPLLGAAVTAGGVPAPDPAELWWKPAAGGPLPLAYGGTRVLPAGPEVLASAVTALLGPLLATFRRRYALAPELMAGNVASALAGAAGMISGERAASLVADTLEEPPLHGSGTLVRPDPERARWFFVRTTCCLYYRLPGGGKCGDCVLTSEDERRRHWRAVLSRP
jgi:hypothetical protein